MNNIVDNVCVTNTVHENIAQEYTCATNSQQLPPSQYILSVKKYISNTFVFITCLFAQIYLSHLIEK